MTVAVLFARADSVYKQMPECDVYDAARDARTFAGGSSIVAHPPCTRWSKMNGVVLSRYPHKAVEFAWGNDGGLFAFALKQVRRWGGVIEHPAESRAFPHFGLPGVGRAPDSFGGWTCELRQVDFGHRAEKRTWLYVVGAHPDDLPPLPATAGEATALCARMADSRRVEVIGRAEREHSPPAFARWLVDLAARCAVKAEAAA